MVLWLDYCASWLDTPFIASCWNVSEETFGGRGSGSGIKVRDTLRVLQQCGTRCLSASLSKSIVHYSHDCRRAKCKTKTKTVALLVSLLWNNFRGSWRQMSARIDCPAYPWVVINRLMWTYWCGFEHTSLLPAWVVSRFIPQSRDKQILLIEIALHISRRCEWTVCVCSPCDGHATNGDGRMDGTRLASGYQIMIMTFTHLYLQK